MEMKRKAPLLTLVGGGSRCCDSSEKHCCQQQFFNSLASSVGVDHSTMSREATKPPGDSEDHHDDVLVK